MSDETRLSPAAPSTDCDVALVARFWNEDGYEMPPLYRAADGSLVCTWNYLLLVAPEIVEVRDV